MIVFLLLSIRAFPNAEFEKVKSLYPDFGRVLERKGYIPAIDFSYAERVYKINDDGVNPFFPFALGEIYRLQKKGGFINYYKKAIKRCKTPKEIFLLDILLAERNIFRLGAELMSKMFTILATKNKSADIGLAEKYEKLSVDKFYAGKVDLAIYLMTHASSVAPMLRRIHIEGMKMSIAARKSSFFHFLLSYLKSAKYINNRLVLYANLEMIFSLLFLYLGVSLLFSGFIDGESFLSRTIRLRTPFRYFWIPGITWCFFVFLPFKVFLIIVYFVSLLRLGKKRGVATGSLLLLSSILLLMASPLLSFVKKGENKNLLIAYYDPENIDFNYNKKDAFSMWLYGEKLIKTGKYKRAREVFSGIKLHRSFKDELYNNIGVTYFLEEKFDTALNYFKKAYEKDKQNPVYIFNLARTYTNLLDFQEASSYFSLLKGNQKKQANILDISPPLSLLKIKSPLKNITFPLKVLIIFIAGLIILAFSIPKRTKGDMFCSVCGTVLVISLELEEKKVCEKCYIALAQSHSKGIRERIKKRIKRKTEMLLQIKNLIFNMIFPGLAHINNGFYFNGIFYAMLYILLLTLRYGDRFLMFEKGYQIQSIEVPILWFVLLILFFISLIISTGRVSEYGSGR